MNRFKLTSLLSTIILSCALHPACAQKVDPFTQYGAPVGSPFMSVSDPKPVAKHWPQPNMGKEASKSTPGFSPFSQPAPTPTPKPVAQPVLSTRQWNVVGLMQGSYPQAILMSGQDSYIVQIGDTLPDGSAKLVSMDTISVTVRSNITKAEIRIPVGSSGAVPVDAAPVTSMPTL